MCIRDSRYAGVPLPVASDLAEDQEVLLMLNSTEIMDTIHMIDQQHLDIRTKMCIRDRWRTWRSLPSHTATGIFRSSGQAR